MLQSCWNMSSSLCLVSESRWVHVKHTCICCFPVLNEPSWGPSTLVMLPTSPLLHVPSEPSCSSYPVFAVFYLGKIAETRLKILMGLEESHRQNGCELIQQWISGERLYKKCKERCWLRLELEKHMAKMTNVHNQKYEQYAHERQNQATEQWEEPPQAFY